MPTNLPPEYYVAEKNYKDASTVHDKVDTLQELISTIPKHKGTDKLRADLRKKLSKLKNTAQSKKQTSKTTSLYSIPTEGAGQIVLFGAPNTGKSTLVAKLTNASPEIGIAPYTTWTPTPGMMAVKDTHVQVIDTPSIHPDYLEPELMNLLRGADMIAIMVDLKTDPMEQLTQAVTLLEDHKIIPLHKKSDIENVQGIAFIPIIALANKFDDLSMQENYEIFRVLLEEDCKIVPISLLNSINLDVMEETIFQTLKIMRVYSKIPGEDIERTSPYILHIGDTVNDFAEQVHQDFVKNLKIARVWGEGCYPGQMVGRDHVLHDGDVVELKI